MGEFGLRAGRADVRSAGPITFGPAGILFLADNAAAKVFAVDVADLGAAGGSGPFDLENVDALVGSFLGCEPSDMVIRDMAVHPLSHNVYLSVQRGRGDAAQAVLVRIGRLDGSITDVPLDDVPVAGWRSATPRPRTTNGWTSRSRWATRARNSRSASGLSASCGSRSGPRPSPTWPT